METQGGSRNHPPEVRAQVMASLLAGQGVAEAARAYKIPVQTVSRWKVEAWREAGRSEDIGELLLNFLREGLTTLAVQLEHFRDLDWLQQQGASESAVLFGVETDKLVRILEALDVEQTEPSTRFNWDPEPRGNGRFR